jgi:hypothetical protein
MMGIGSRFQNGFGGHGRARNAGQVVRSVQGEAGNRIDLHAQRGRYSRNARRSGAAHRVLPPLGCAGSVPSASRNDRRCLRNSVLVP